MPIALQDRLREASLELDAERQGALDAAIQRVASARPALPDLLTRVRLSHSLPVADPARGQFISQINREAELLGQHGSDHLVAILATCALIERFAKTDRPRAATTIRILTTATLAIRNLQWAPEEPAHPDVVEWASFWLESHAQHVRRATGIGGIPRAKASAKSEEAEEQVILTQDIAAVREYADELSDWLERTAGAAAILALREQLEISWWLASRRDTDDPMTAAVTGAVALRSMTLSPPPRSSRELLKRFLGTRASKYVRLEEFDRLRPTIPALQKAASGAPEFTPFLSGRVAREEVEAVDLAHGLFSELVLVELLEAEAAKTADEEQERGESPADKDGE